MGARETLTSSQMRCMLIIIGDRSFFGEEPRMTKDQRVLYDNVGEVRNADAALRWSIAQLFLVLNSALFTMFMTRPTEEISAKIVMCITGVVLGVLWLSITNRTQELLTYWNNRLRAFEQLDRQEVYVFGGEEYRMLQGKVLTTYNILCILILFVGLVWLSIFMRLMSILKP